MATPAEISIASACLACIPDKLSAMLYLLAVQAGVTDPATISANAACYACIPNKQDAVLYLLDQIAGGGSSGSQVTCGDTDPVAAPTGSCVLYFNTESQELFAWDGASWLPVVPPASASGVTCGAVDPVAAPSTSCGIYINTSNLSLWVWNGSAWNLKV